MYIYYGISLASALIIISFIINVKKTKKIRDRQVVIVEEIFKLRNNQLAEVFRCFFKLAKTYKNDKNCHDWLKEQENELTSRINKLNNISKYNRKKDTLVYWFRQREIAMAELHSLVFDILANTKLAQMGELLATMDTCVEGVYTQKNHFEIEDINYFEWLANVINRETVALCQDTIRVINKNNSNHQKA